MEKREQLAAGMEKREQPAAGVEKRLVVIVSKFDMRTAMLCSKTESLMVARGKWCPYLRTKSGEARQRRGEEMRGEETRRDERTKSDNARQGVGATARNGGVRRLPRHPPPRERALLLDWLWPRRRGKLELLNYGRTIVGQ